MHTEIKRQSQELFRVEENKERKNMKKVHVVHRYTRKIVKQNPNRALFSKEATERIMNHDTSFKFD